MLVIHKDVAFRTSLYVIVTMGIWVIELQVKRM